MSLEFETYFKNFRKSATITDIRRLPLDQKLQDSRNIERKFAGKFVNANRKFRNF